MHGLTPIDGAINGQKLPRGEGRRGHAGKKKEEAVWGPLVSGKRNEGEVH